MKSGLFNFLRHLRFWTVYSIISIIPYLFITFSIYIFVTGANVITIIGLLAFSPFIFLFWNESIKVKEFYRKEWNYLSPNISIGELSEKDTFPLFVTKNTDEGIILYQFESKEEYEDWKHKNMFLLLMLCASEYDEKSLIYKFKFPRDMMKLLLKEC